MDDLGLFVRSQGGRLGEGEIYTCATSPHPMMPTRRMGESAAVILAEASRLLVDMRG